MSRQGLGLYLRAGGQEEKILFVGCKQQAQQAVSEAARAAGQFYVNHHGWGTLTNLATIRQSVERLKYLEGIEKAPEYKAMSKKELAALNREKNKLLRNLQGVREMAKPHRPSLSSTPPRNPSPLLKRGASRFPLSG